MKLALPPGSSGGFWWTPERGRFIIRTMLVKFEVYKDDSFWCARGIGHDILRQAESVDELYENIKEAVAVHFEDRPAPIEIDILAQKMI